MKKIFFIFFISIPLNAVFDVKLIHKIGDFCAIGGSVLIGLSSLAIYSESNKRENEQRGMSVIEVYKVDSAEASPSDDDSTAEKTTRRKSYGYATLSRLASFTFVFSDSDEDDDRETPFLSADYSGMYESDQDDELDESIIKTPALRRLKYYKVVQRLGAGFLGVGALLLGVSRIMIEAE